MHTHSHHHTADYGRAFFIAIALNTVFVIAEVIFGLQADSLALLADAGHNASDVLGLCMAASAIWLARRKPSTRFTYGLQSASIMAALANALLLLIALGGIGWEALYRFSKPAPIATGTVMIVAAIGAVVGGATAWMFKDGHAHDLNIRGAYLHMAADAIISIGVVISALLIWLTGWQWLDPLVSLIIVAIIVRSSWRMLKESMYLALHAVPQDIDPLAVKTYLCGLSGVKEVHDLHIWAMSTTGVAMSVHLIIPGGHPGDAFIHQVTHELEEKFRIGHATIQIEIGDGMHSCHLASDHVV